MHPWLGYQNLVDGSLSSVSSPGHYWKDFALGRASTESLIPKPTTLMSAISHVLPNLNSNIEAMSFRVPTSIVSVSDMVLTLKRKISKNNVLDIFYNLSKKYPSVVLINEDPLVSIDFKGIEQSCVIDIRWIKLINEQKLKLVLWYDNEWGYSKRVVDLMKLLC